MDNSSNKIRIVKLFLRLALSLTFFSAVADRFGGWSYHVAWGNWGSFVNYTHQLLPWLSSSMNSFIAIMATLAEVILGILILVGWKTKMAAFWSGILLLLFALAMSFSNGLKTAFDASVFTASAAAFALSTLKTKFLEIDCWTEKRADIDYNVIQKYIDHE